MSQNTANSPQRLRWIARFALLWALAIGARLIQLQVSEREEYQALADRQQNRDIAVEAPRGEILDRNGQLLAMNVPVKSAVLSLEGITDTNTVAKRIAKALGMQVAPLAESLRKGVDSGASYVSIKRRLLPEQAAALDALGIPQVAYRPETKRVYPNGALASNLIGWVNDAGVGAGGLEYALNKSLTGADGRMKVVLDSRRRRANSEVTKDPQPGRTLRTTIDIRIQHVADEAIKKAVLDNHAATGSVTVMDPNTGEVLAMSSYPTFDPNEPLRKNGVSSRVNQAISNRYEPGSVFKVITFASALEHAGLKPTDMINCGHGIAHAFGRVIHDHDSYAQLTATDVLAKSSNVGTINIALNLGLDRLVGTIGAFGFGKKTNVGLPGEAAGLVPRYKNQSLGYVAIGHEIAVTNIQLARAASAVANGGFLIDPRVVSALEGPAGAQPAKATGRVRVIAPETALTLRQMMEHVVLPGGTGTRAKFSGYTAGGKTGSAQIFDFSTGHYSHNYNSSFMGFAPVNDPNVVVVVTINGADKFGGVLAAPVFNEIASAAMRVREVRRDVPDDPATAPVPDSRLADNSATPDRPGMGANDLKVDPVAAELAALEPTLVGPRVPDFRGKSMTAVVSQSVALGMKVEMFGRGLVRAQVPPPGAELSAGQKVRLTFAP
jgi:cell division protein FtsI (penicillin-binding protein 3)